MCWPNRNTSKKASINQMNKKFLKREQLLLISFLIILLDQLSKEWATQALSPGITKPLLPWLLQLQIVRNTGAAFSLFSNSTFFLGLLSLLVGIGLIVWIWNHAPVNTWQGLSLAFLLGGTIGNGFDRWRLGHVIDFIELRPIEFPIFNVADIAINIALLCFAVDVIKRRNKGQVH